MMKLFYYISMGTILFITGLILLIFFWYNWPYKVVEFKEPIHILTPIVHVGENLIYELDYCKHVDIPATLSKEYIDGVVYAAPPVVVNNPKGCGIKNGITLVPNLLEGVYSMRFSYSYKMNPIRTITIVVESEKFEVRR